MLGTRHQIPQWVRLALGPLSVSALLAFALFPPLANAEDSSGIQYSDAPPTATDKTPREEPASSSSAGRGKDGPGQSSTRSGSTDGRMSDGGAGQDDSSGGAAGSSVGGGGGDSGASGAGNSGGEKSANTIAPAPASGEDGSSPLVPILIALAALAAISIGAVAMRRRRQEPGEGGTAVSHEAS